jgi:hypothetical protein
MYSFHYIKFGTRGELWVLRQSADPQRVESKGADRQGADFREKVKVPIFEKKSRCRFSRKSQGADPANCRPDYVGTFGTLMVGTVTLHRTLTARVNKRTFLEEQMVFNTSFLGINFSPGGQLASAFSEETE